MQLFEVLSQARQKKSNEKLAQGDLKNEENKLLHVKIIIYLLQGVEGDDFQEL